jgi:uncharacterized protein
MPGRIPMGLRKSLGIIVALAVLVVLGAAWHVGSLLISSHHCLVQKPAGFQAQDVDFVDSFGERIKCWWMPTGTPKPTIIIVHGIGANRLAMVGRAIFYKNLGYSVFLFDLPAHGESEGERVTFGPHEAAAVSGALYWVRENSKDRRIGVDGVSLGGAGVLLRSENSGFDVVILEAVYPDIHRAPLNRLTDRLGIIGYILEPPFLAQLILRLRESPASLSPTSRISEIDAPVLVIGGERDHLAKISETRELFAHAGWPKELWVVPGCGHDDFLAKRPAAYSEVVSAFLGKYLPD